MRYEGEEGFVKQCIDRAQYRKTLREPVVRRREELSELMRPLREDWAEQVREGQARGVRRYDGTAILALDQAGSQTYSMLTATDNIWAPLEYEEEWRKDDPDARAWITKCNRITFASFDPSRDNFYNDAVEVILDSIGLGDGVFYSARPPGADFFHSKAIPWREVSFDIGMFGDVTHLDRWYREPLWSVAEEFGVEALPERHRVNLDKQPNQKVDLLHTCVPNEGKTNRISSVHQVASIYILMDGRAPLRFGGYREMPYYVSRWGVPSGETYGMGRGVMALPDAQVLNEMERTSLTAAQRIAQPPVIASDELAGLVSLDMDYVNYGAVDDRGNQLVRTLQTGGNPAITLEMMEQKRAAIRDVFYHAMLSIAGSPTPSTIEVLEQAERRDQSMGPNLARIINEFLAPFVEGRFRELARAGRFPPPPETAAGAKVKVRFVSPLARAHRAQAAQATMAYVNGVREIAAVDPTARHAVHGLRAARRLHDGLSAPEDIQKTADEIEASLQQEAEAAQAEQELDVAERGGRAAAAAGQAVQAMQPG